MPSDDKRNTDFALADRLVWLAFASVLLLSGIVAFSYFLNASEFREMEHPTPAAISQRMAMVCPSVADLGERISCSTQAIDDLRTQHQRTQEIRNQNSALSVEVVGIGLVLANLFITVAALGYLVRTFTATRRAAEAAEAAAKAAGAANIGFQISSERQLRAYVAVSETVLSNLGLGLVPHLRVSLTNSGQTPATEVVVVTTCYKRQLTSPVPPAPAIDALPDPSSRTLGSGGVCAVESNWPAVLSAAEHAAIVNGTFELGVALRCRYRDIFENTHEFTFRGHSWIHAGQLQFVAAPQE